jgi:hypothetical protein
LFDIPLHSAPYIEQPDDEHGALRCYAATLSPAIATQQTGAAQLFLQ